MPLSTPLDVRMSCTHACPHHCGIGSGSTIGHVSRSIEDMDKHIKKQYVTIMIPLKRARNSFSSACRLPQELLSQITVLQAPDDEDDKIIRRNSLAQVCSVWRSHLLNDRSLWQDIDLSFPRMAKELLSRGTGSRSVSVNLVVPPQCSPARKSRMRKAFVQALKHAKDIKTLTLTVTNTFAVHEVLSALHKSNPSFSSMTSLSISITDASPREEDLLDLSILCHSAPHLESLTLSSCCISWDSALFSQLSALTLSGMSNLRMTPEQWHNILSNIERLVYLKIRLAAVPDLPSDEGQITLPNLTKIHLEGPYDHITRFLMHLKLPANHAVRANPWRGDHGVGMLAPYVRSAFAQHAPATPLSVAYIVYNFTDRVLKIVAPQSKLAVDMPSVMRNDEFEIEELFEHITPNILSRVRFLHVLHIDDKDFYTDSVAWQSCFRLLKDVHEVTVDDCSARGLFSLWTRTPAAFPAVVTLCVIGLDKAQRGSLLTLDMVAALRNRARVTRSIRKLAVDSASTISSAILSTLLDIGITVDVVDVNQLEPEAWFSL